ncbi:flagellar biosynthesis protein FliQ [Polycladidibacter hongkongensis]|uniref:flagellar biosynthesis protein FliQ n=1 Tax=Polycladidibacter hongkongensis TaxID=1647556 RepID=UPI000835FF71|nr:flagellar biosynthesis protein FliQ [Pseudovibrio hongkongensis]
MTGAEVLDIASSGIWTLIKLSVPVLLVGLVVGVIVALFQALTQIQEQTLVFVPKIISIFLALLVAFPFMGSVLGSFTEQISQLIVSGF